MPRHAALFLAVALSGAFLDLWTKHAVFVHFEAHPWPREVVVVEGYLAYGKTFNPGVVFGMGPKFQTFWKVVSVLAVPAIAAIFFSVKKPRWILSISLGMILAGTLGNMYDRLKFDAVRDFLKFFVVGADGREKVWPLFNLADSYICVGVFLLTVEMMFFDEKKKKEPAPPAEAPPAVRAEAAPPTP